MIIKTIVLILFSLLCCSAHAEMSFPAHTVQIEDMIPIPAGTANIGKITLTDGIDNAGVDHEVRALQTITVEHHEIHEGELFTATWIDDAVSDSASTKFIVWAPTTTYMHANFDVATQGKAQVALFENSTYSGGIRRIPRNHHRAISDDAAMIKAEATVVDWGTRIFWNLVPGGNTVQTRSGAGNKTSNEWIATAGKCYMLVITNTSGSASDIGITWGYYKVD